MENNASQESPIEPDEDETYYDLFLRYWGNLAEIVRTCLPPTSGMAAMCKTATPSRVIAAVDYFTSVVVAAEKAGVSESSAIAKVLQNFGAPADFCSGENLAKVVKAISDLRKILEACRKE